MINQEILDYIKNQLDNGKGEEEIRLKLGKVGWLKEDIDLAFTKISGDKPPVEAKIPPIQDNNPLPKTRPAYVNTNKISTSTNDDVPYVRPIEESQISAESTVSSNSNKSGIYNSLKIILILIVIFIIAAGIGLAGYFLYNSGIVKMPANKEPLTSEQIAQRSFVNLLEAPDIEIKSNTKLALKSENGETWGDITFLADLKVEKKFTNDEVNLGDADSMIDILINFDLKTIEDNLPQTLKEQYISQKQEMIEILKRDMAGRLNIQNLENLIDETFATNVRLRFKLLGDDMFIKLDDIRVGGLSLLDNLSIPNIEKWIEIKDARKALTEGTGALPSQTNLVEQNNLIGLINMDYTRMIDIKDVKEITKNDSPALSFDYNIKEQYLKDLYGNAISQPKESELLISIMSNGENNIIVDKESYQVLENSSLIKIMLGDLIDGLIDINKNTDNVDMPDTYNTELVESFKEYYPDTDLTDEEIIELERLMRIVRGLNLYIELSNEEIIDKMDEISELEEMLRKLHLEVTSKTEYSYPVTPLEFTRPDETIDLMSLMTEFFMGGAEQERQMEIDMDLDVDFELEE